MVYILAFFAATLFTTIGYIVGQSFKSDRERNLENVIIAESNFITKLRREKADTQHQLEMAIRCRNAVLKNHVLANNKEALDKITNDVDNGIEKNKPPQRYSFN